MNLIFFLFFNLSIVLKLFIAPIYYKYNKNAVTIVLESERGDQGMEKSPVSP